MISGQVCLRRGETLAAGCCGIYDNEIDWADDTCEDGGLVEVLDSRMRYQGTGFFNRRSKITVRLVSRERGETIDRAFWERRIRAAWENRQALGFSNACRVIFGEPDGLPGLAAEGGAHGIRHIGIRLKAARADARTDGRADVLRSAAELPLHGLDRAGRNARRRAAPARMGRADGACHWVKQQHGRAVGGENGQCNARLVRHKAVDAVLRLPLQAAAAVRAADTLDEGGMHLLREHGLLRRKANGPAETGIILQHVFRPVAPVRAEVQAGERALAHSAEAGGKGLFSAGKKQRYANRSGRVPALYPYFHGHR